MSSVLSGKRQNSAPMALHPGHLHPSLHPPSRCCDKNFKLALKMAHPFSVAPCISFTDIEEAAKRIKGFANVTPVVSSRLFNDKTHSQHEVFFKCENFQRSGSFKVCMD